MEVVTRLTGRDQADVIASAAAGDEMAFKQIIAAHHDDMRRVVRYVTRDDAITDEAVQAAWAIAWRKLGSVRELERLKPWLISIAVNEAKQLLRKRRRRAEIEVASDAPAGSGSGDPGANVDAIDLRSAIERLDVDDQALLAMRYVAGFDATELSAATGISPAGTRTRLKRLLDRLRQELADG
jgi:RNA polymerase sigma-70 factor (ECF subfamily)